MVRLERSQVESIVEHFQSLADPRDMKNRRHLLVDVMVLSVCGVIVGCDGPTAIERWAQAKQDWLQRILELPNGIPSHDCIRRILLALKPEAFQKCFEKWIALCLKAPSDSPLEEDSPVRQIAIDGKTLRRSHDRASGLGPLHLVSAWPALSSAGASIAPPCSGRDRSVARRTLGDVLAVSAFPLYVPG